jgi:hypothetical protein
MRKLTQRQLQERVQKQVAIQTAQEELEFQIEELNRDIARRADLIKGKLAILNQAIASADDWRKEIVDEMESYFDERSDNWQNGDAGVSYSVWIERWQQPFCAVEYKLPTGVDSPSVTASDELGELPDDPEGL